jgi:LmbE family N-acetylglucosaminyl deacetylase
MTHKTDILAIGSHPDDLEYGCGGTLLKYARGGHRVYLWVATRGTFGGEGEVRWSEMEESARRMGAAELIQGGYTDTRIPLSQELIADLESVIARIRPTFIFTHWQEDTHQDHRNLTACTLSATRYIPNFLFYEGPTSQNFAPNVYVDITDVLEDKLGLLQSHASQMTKTNIEETTILDMARSSATFRGIQARVRHAEGFTSQRLLIDI